MPVNFKTSGAKQSNFFFFLCGRDGIQASGGGPKLPNCIIQFFLIYHVKVRHGIGNIPGDLECTVGSFLDLEALMFCLMAKILLLKKVVKW